MVGKLLDYGTDPFADLAAIGEALRAATYNYQHGIGFDVPVEEWLNRDRRR